ncbi:MAG TPA: hypothetical protein VFL42_09295 [Terriglobales bacterium]|nr:hypothetical protein [Terriglobales bacterium]
MKKHWLLFNAMLAVSAIAVAQVAAGGSTSAGASVNPGQANANVNNNQSAQAGGASATTNAAGAAQVSHEHDAKKEGGKHEHGANAGSASGPAGNTSAAVTSASSLQAELTKSIDAGKCKPGDEVTAKLTQDFKSDGKVVYHKGSKLIGHVTEAQAHTKDHAGSKLGVVFDKVQPKGGEEAQIHGVVQALAPPANAMLASSADQSLSAPAMGGGRSGGGGGGGLLGGVGGGATSTVGGVAGSAGNVAGGVAGGVTSNVGSTVNGAAGSGLSAQGTLTSASRGVLGMQGLSLNSVTGATTDASVISSATRTVKLESGTQMLLQLSGAAK